MWCRRFIFIDHIYFYLRVLLWISSYKMNLKTIMPTAPDITCYGNRGIFPFRLRYICIRNALMSHASNCFRTSGGVPSNCKISNEKLAIRPGLLLHDANQNHINRNDNYEHAFKDWHIISERPKSFSQPFQFFPFHNLGGLLSQWATVSFSKEMTVVHWKKIRDVF